MLPSVPGAYPVSRAASSALSSEASALFPSCGRSSEFQREGGVGALVLTRRRYTFDEWIDSPEHTPLAELVERIPVERMATTPSHGEVVGELWDWLRRAQRAGAGRVYAGPVGVLLDTAGERRNVREPDLFFIRREREHIVTARAVQGVPDLAIEVLSPTGVPRWRDDAAWRRS